MPVGTPRVVSPSKTTVRTEAGTTNTKKKLNFKKFAAVSSPAGFRSTG